MTETIELGPTIVVDHPTWNGNGFDEPEASVFWSELPEVFRQIAAREMSAGNRVDQILRNGERSIVVLVFSDGPCTEMPAGPQVVTHRRHEYGNYCYEDTSCTLEHKESGSFLAFLRVAG